MRFYNNYFIIIIILEFCFQQLITFIKTTHIWRILYFVLTQGIMCL